MATHKKTDRAAPRPAAAVRIAVPVGEPAVTVLRTASLTLVAMLAFAANSVLCRLALQQTAIDPGSFTVIRLVSGAVMLAVLLQWRRLVPGKAGNWGSALALFAYAAGFSFAYVSLPTGVGALLLFAAVQVTMILTGLARGERLGARQTAGLALAFGGLVYLLLPGLSAPPLGGSLLMIGAGIAWGVYSLRGRGISNALAATGGNFLRTVPMAIGLGMLGLGEVRVDPAGALYAVLSGALASGAGYAVWYAALRGLTATRAATVQLAVPVIAAAGGVLFLGEAVTLRLAVSSLAILGGVALVLLRRR